MCIRDRKYTVKFWIFRNFFDSPSTYLIYTEDDKNIKYYNEKIKNDPERNWKIDNNWYRTVSYTHLDVYKRQISIS